MYRKVLAFCVGVYVGQECKNVPRVGNFQIVKEIKDKLEYIKQSKN